MGLWTEYKKKTKVETDDTFLIYNKNDGVMQVTGSNVKTSLRDIPDATLTQPDTPADAAAVGKALDTVKEEKKQQDTVIKQQGETLARKVTGSGIELFYDSTKGCMAAKITT